MAINGYSTWLEIDLGAIRNNVRNLQKLTNTNVMAVVKANGYGHGASAVAKAATQAGATWCGVARLDEALNLRRAGINTRILVLGYTPPDRIPDAIANNITLTVYDPQVGNEYAQKAIEQGQDVRVHVKVDTGMGRLGMQPAEALTLLRQMRAAEGLAIEGIFTHFARADEPNMDTTGQQLKRFNALLAKLDQAKLRPKMTHAANSAGAIYFPESRFDLVRTGIAIYGLDPSPEAPLPKNFQAALSWKARLSSKKTLPAAHGVSYGHKYSTQTEECFGVVPVGYADGFRRIPGNFLLIAGQRVPVMGNITMDQAMIQLDRIPPTQIGAEVVLIGSQGQQKISAQELAASWGTISYEVVCGLADRLPRFYINETPENA